jgi:hypothetical protein
MQVCTAEMEEEVEELLHLSPSSDQAADVVRESACGERERMW